MIFICAKNVVFIFLVRKSQILSAKVGCLYIFIIKYAIILTDNQLNMMFFCDKLQLFYLVTVFNYYFMEGFHWWNTIND